MIIVPSEEAETTSNPPHGPSEASLGTEADHRPAEGPAGGSQSQAPLPAVDSAEGSAAAAPEHQDVDQATSEAQPTSGDQDGSGQEPGEITSPVPQDPGALQVFVGRPNLLPVGVADHESVPQGGVALPTDSKAPERTPPKASGPKSQLVFALSPADAADPATVGTGGLRHPQPSSVTKAAEKAEGSQMVTREDLVDSSKELRVQSFLPSPACSAPPSPSPSPSPHVEAPGRRLLDSDLYMADEDSGYMRSMTSLLGGGEGSISSLADILVWSEPMGMTMAMGFLASGHSSPTELLRSTGPSLRSVSSILRSASSTFSSGLVTGTGSALRSVTQVLETVERRTMESIRSAMRYLTSHLTPRRFHAGPS